MKKNSLVFLTMFILGTLACGSTAPPSTPEPASVAEASPVPEKLLSPTEYWVTEQGEVTESTVFVPGLRVVYIRGGNLWSWMEAGGSSQLTDTGDMSTIRVSDDGQLLAFMRGNEVWTVRIDGTDARLVDTQTSENGKLWLAPNNILLAISANDHIDLLDLNSGEKTNVITYPAVSDGYAPEVIWMPDSSGFKTIIPMASDQAEMIYVFPDGTLASLAKFTMVFSPDNPFYFSPDGGYVSYTAKVDDGSESLNLMDSSGATRPYGEPSDSIRAYGWIPGTKNFVYGQNGASGLFVGQVDSPPVEIDHPLPENIRWVDASGYLAILDGELIWGDLNGAALTIDSDVMEFDFLLVN